MGNISMRGSIIRTARFGAGCAALLGMLWGCSSDDGAAPPVERGEGSTERTIEVLKATFPKARLKVSGDRIDRVYGAVLSEGATAGASVERFVKDYASALGINASDLKSVTLENGRALAPAAPAPLGLMYDEKTGKYGYWLYRFGQYRGGLRVYGAELLTLVKNTSNNPVVWAASTMRGMGRFVPPSLGKAAPNTAKALRSLGGSRDFKGDPIAPPVSFTHVSASELVVFAGAGERNLAPRMGVEFVAESANPPGKWRFVTDASTGDVLHVEDMIVFEAVAGSAAGRVTSGVKAMDCADELPTGLPYAEVAIEGGASDIADVSGAFSIDHPGTEAVNVQSLVGGQYFDVTDYSGTAPQIVQSVVPPGPVSLLHNPDNLSDGARAHTNGYVHANQIRDFLLSYVPNYPTIATQLNFPVSVNRTDLYCPGNAWYDSASINFCVGSTSYGNTSFASVNHHEYGHHIVSSGGSGQGAYGEGMSDTIAMLFSGDPGLGYGFYLNQCNNPLRTADNDCQYSASSCSSCGSASHSCGKLISGTIWDIRQALAQSGLENYAEIINALVLNSVPMHTGAGIDSSIAVDLLTLDDDDGNLSNGSPHYAQICSGFEQHGMECPPLSVGLELNTEAGLQAEGPLGGPFAPESVTYTLTNLGPDPVIDYSVTTGNPDWIDVTNATGQLDVGESAQVTVAIDQDAAALLGNGVHSGTVQFFNETNGSGNTTRDVKLEVGIPMPIFTENFEQGIGQFALDSGTTNHWHVTANCASAQPGHSQPNSLFFGQDSSCNYALGNVKGTVTSTPVVVNDTSLVKLRFKYFLQTENGG